MVEAGPLAIFLAEPRIPKLCTQSSWVAEAAGGTAFEEIEQRRH